MGCLPAPPRWRGEGGKRRPISVARPLKGPGWERTAISGLPVRLHVQCRLRVGAGSLAHMPERRNRRSSLGTDLVACI